MGRRQTPRNQPTNRVMGECLAPEWMGLQKKSRKGDKMQHSPRASRNRKDSPAASLAVQAYPGPYRNTWDWQGCEGVVAQRG